MSEGAGPAFLSAARHEMVNHLMAATTLADIASHCNDEKRASVIDRLESELASLNVLAGEVFSSLEGNVFGQPRPVDLSDVLDAAIARFGPGRCLRAWSCRAPAVADPDALGQALACVLRFGLQWSGRSVEAAVLPGRGRVVFLVRFPATADLKAAPERVFDPIFPKTSLRLGLAFARSVAEAHGGSAGAIVVDGDCIEVFLELPGLRETAPTDDVTGQTEASRTGWPKGAERARWRPARR